MSLHNQALLSVSTPEGVLAIDLSEEFDVHHQFLVRRAIANFWMPFVGSALPESFTTGEPEALRKSLRALQERIAAGCARR